MESMRQTIDQFRRRTIVVLGDVVADEYIYGTTHRISREAPVLVVRHEVSEMRLGGAGNVAHNLACLGADVLLVGVVGEDDSGRRVQELCREGGIGTTGLVADPGRLTNTKTRILAGSVHTTRQQMLRLDRENPTPISGSVESRLLDCLDACAGRAEAIVVSDYGDGVLTPRVIERVRALAATGHRVVVDSRFNLNAYRGVTAVKPNEPEAEVASQMTIRTERDVVAAGDRLLAELACQGVLITRGRRGMVLFRPGSSPQIIPAWGSEEVTDVTGAGDTVLAVFTLALAAGADFVEAGRLANVAGGLVVMKQGTATVSPPELHAALVRGEAPAAEESGVHTP